VTHHHDVGSTNRGFLFHDSPGLLRAPRPTVPLHHIDSFDNDRVLIGEHPKDFAGFSSLLPRNHHDAVILANLHARLLPNNCLKDFRRERNNFHEFLGPYFACYRSKYASTDRLLLIVDQHSRIVVESDVGSVRPSYLLCRAHHHGLHHFALFYFRIGNRFLDGNHNNIPDGCILPFAAPQDFNALHLARSRVIRHIQHRSHLNHELTSLTAQTVAAFDSSASVVLARARIRLTRQRLSRLSGRHSTIKTRSPTWLWFCSS